MVAPVCAVKVSPATREGLIDHVRQEGAIRCGSAKDSEIFTQRVADLLQLIVSTREYQFA